MLELKENKKRCVTVWEIENGNGSGPVRTKMTELSLIGNSISNKFGIVTGLVHEMSENIDGFEGWYKKLLKTYIKDKDPNLLLENVPNFFLYANKYLEYKNVNFDEFVNMSKRSKTSIIFDADDIKMLALCSTCLKLFAPYYCSAELQMSENMYKRIYDSLIAPCIERDITNKIFQVIRAKTYKSSMTDKCIWDFVRIALFETPESYVMTVFNFVMKSILVLLDIRQNPIPFIIASVDDSLKWLMRNIYKDKIIYGDSFGAIEDVSGTTMSKENFYLYCCQDVISKSVRAGMNILESMNIPEGEFFKIKDRLDEIKYLFPTTKFVIAPVVSKVLEVPYKFFLTIQPHHAMLLGIFMYKLGEEDFNKRFPILSEFLIACPKNHNSMSARSDYKIRNFELIVNEDSPIFGFSSKIMKYNLLSNIAGILFGSKKNLVSILNGKPLPKMTHYTLENDVCAFYTELYSNKLDTQFEKMRERADYYLS